MDMRNVQMFKGAIILGIGGRHVPSRMQSKKSHGSNSEMRGFGGTS